MAQAQVIVLALNHVYLSMILIKHKQTAVDPDSEPKILVIGPSWVGDMMMAQALFIALKQQQPKATIDVLALGWCRPILARMPQVNRTIAMPLGHGKFDLKGRKALGVSLRHEGYDQAIVLPNSWKSALIPWFANIPLRTGWKGEARYFLLNDLRKLNKTTLPMMVQRYVALAYPRASAERAALDHCPLPALQVDSRLLPALAEKFKLSRQPMLAICPGAEFGPAKQWPIDYYADLAKQFVDKGWQVAIMGSPSDGETGEAIASRVGSGSIVNLCGKTSLEEAIDILSMAEKVVSNDSGLMHIASALNRPLIALYGPTSADFTPPLCRDARILSVKVDCGPCFQRLCPEGHQKCMTQLGVDTVINELDAIG